MNSYDVTYQLVDSPIDESKPGGTIAADRLIEAFQGFPFAEEVKKAETMKDGAATFPTITFRRKSDGEEIAIWTDNAIRFDLCFVHGARKKFLNSQSKEEVEARPEPLPDGIGARHPATELLVSHLRMKRSDWPLEPN